jgi:hypothetical protein
VQIVMLDQNLVAFLKVLARGEQLELHPAQDSLFVGCRPTKTDFSLRHAVRLKNLFEYVPKKVLTPPCAEIYQDGQVRPKWRME